HARKRVADIAGDRALEGVVEEVWFRGELVGHRRRYDSRLLLAHLARLDKLVEAQGPAAPAAQALWFDAGLARLAGHAEPEGFAEAQGLWDEEPHPDEAEVPAHAVPPPTREEWAAWFADRAAEGVKRKDEARVLEEARAEAEALYDAWQAGC